MVFRQKLGLQDYNFSPWPENGDLRNAIFPKPNKASYTIYASKNNEIYVEGHIPETPTMSNEENFHREKDED